MGVQGAGTGHLAEAGAVQIAGQGTGLGIERQGHHIAVVGGHVGRHRQRAPRLLRAVPAVHVKLAVVQIDVQAAHRAALLVQHLAAGHVVAGLKRDGQRPAGGRRPGVQVRAVADRQHVARTVEADGGQAVHGAGGDGRLRGVGVLVGVVAVAGLVGPAVHVGVGMGVDHGGRVGGVQPQVGAGDLVRREGVDGDGHAGGALATPAVADGVGEAVGPAVAFARRVGVGAVAVIHQRAVGGRADAGNGQRVAVRVGVVAHQIGRGEGQRHVVQGGQRIGDRRGRLVLVGQHQIEAFGGGQPAGIGGGDRDGHPRPVLEAERHAVLQLQLAVDHLEAGIVDRVGVDIAGILVGGRQLADDGPRHFLDDPVVVQRDGVRRVVAVAQMHGHGAAGGQSAGIAHFHRDGVPGLVLEVEQARVGHRDRAGGLVDGEAAAGIVGQREGQAVAGVRVGRHDGAQHGARRGILEHRVQRAVRGAGVPFVGGVGGEFGHLVGGQRGVPRHQLADAAGKLQPAADRGVGHRMDGAAVGVADARRAAVGPLGGHAQDLARLHAVEVAAQAVLAGVGGGGVVDHGHRIGLARLDHAQVDGVILLAGRPFPVVVGERPQGRGVAVVGIGRDGQAVAAHRAALLVDHLGAGHVGAGGEGGRERLFGEAGGVDLAGRGHHQRPVGSPEGHARMAVDPVGIDRRRRAAGRGVMAVAGPVGPHRHAGTVGRVAGAAAVHIGGVEPEHQAAAAGPIGRCRQAGHAERGAFVDVAHRDGVGLGHGLAGRVAYLHRDVVAVRRFMVDAVGVGDAHLARGLVDGEAAVGVVGQREAVAVTGVGVVHLDLADHVAVGGILVDRGVVQRGGDRRVVDGRDGDLQRAGGGGDLAGGGLGGQRGHGQREVGLGVGRRGDGQRGQVPAGDVGLTGIHAGGEAVRTVGQHGPGGQAFDDHAQGFRPVPIAQQHRNVEPDGGVLGTGGIAQHHHRGVGGRVHREADGAGGHGPVAVGDHVVDLVGAGEVGRRGVGEAAVGGQHEGAAGLGGETAAGHRQRGAAVRVGVVGQHVAGQHHILKRGHGIDGGHRRIVGAGDGDGHGGGVGRALAVGDGVADRHLDRLAVGQRQEVAGRVEHQLVVDDRHPAPLGLDGHADQRQSVAVHVPVVGQHVDGEQPGIAGRRGVGDRLGRVVDGADDHGQRGGRAAIATGGDHLQVERAVLVGRRDHGQLGQGPAGHVHRVDIGGGGEAVGAVGQHRAGGQAGKGDRNVRGTALAGHGRHLQRNGGVLVAAGFGHRQQRRGRDRWRHRIGRATALVRGLARLRLFYRGFVDGCFVDRGFRGRFAGCGGGVLRGLAGLGDVQKRRRRAARTGVASGRRRHRAVGGGRLHVGDGAAGDAAAAAGAGVGDGLAGPAGV